MDYKPADFFIGVIDFFGILVPGATLLYLQSRLISPFVTGHFSGQSGQIAFWISFILGSYVLGHLILGIGVPMNRLHLLRLPEDKDYFYQAVRDRIVLPKGVPGTRANAFHRAYCSICLQSPSALGEIERQMADYKLFRSLAIVFALDCVLVFAFSYPRDWPRILLSFSLFVLTLARFLFLLGWTYRATFEFHSLLESLPLRNSEDQEITPNIYEATGGQGTDVP
ncbi:MAG TPA: hypothetical protein VN493_09515 [Thermoanaerobaculia bacterium]|nr:hypothetical protein [Thermoanaerobaculia bacterium]